MQYECKDQLSPESKAYFRGEFRRARLAALSDAEDFQDIVICLERLGLAVTHRLGALGNYGECIGKLAGTSALADTPASARPYHLPFADLYEIVKDGRNDALHQGVPARHLAGHAIQLALVLEDALTPSEPKITGFMARDPVCAAPWQPISFVRQEMLANSFSYLPILWSANGSQVWHFVSDLGWDASCGQLIRRIRERIGSRLR